MPLSTDVNLPKKHEAIFPERCVRWGCDPEGRSIRIWTSSIGWWTAVFWMFGRGFTARIPACRSCGWRIRVQRVGGLICVVVFGFFFLVLVGPYLEGFVPRSLRKWVAMGLLLLCLSPWFLWEVLFPPAIDITAYSKSVDYEFRDSNYAHDFAELNQHAEWINVD